MWLDIVLIGIGLSIIYNLGSNIVLGEISYITQALTAVLHESSAAMKNGYNRADN